MNKLKYYKMESSADECDHVFEEIEDTIFMCEKCGIEKVGIDLNYDNEWNQSKLNSESRCNYKSYSEFTTNMNLINILKNYETSENRDIIINDIYDLYQKVVKGDIVRDPYNKSILIICANTIYKSKYNRILELIKLQKHFNLKRKQVLNGLKFFNTKVKINNINLDLIGNGGVDTKNEEITVIKYLRSIGSELSLKLDIIDESIVIYNDLICNYKEINHIAQKSIAVSILKYLIKKYNIKNIDVINLSKRYNIPDTSILKVEKILLLKLITDNN
jgi:hypothetical protein